MQKRFRKATIFTRFISIILILSMFSSTAALGLDLKATESLDATILDVSEARQKYFSLLEGNYLGRQMREKFVELFGDYSNEYILENYSTIFDMPENEVDQGLLAMITMETDVVQSIQRRGFSLGSGNDDIAPPDNDYPIYAEAEPELVEPIVTEDIAVSSNDVENEVGASQESETFASIQPTAALYNQASNGFTSISLVSVTNTSAVLDIWYQSNSVNNQLKKYDSYAKTWTYILGNGMPAATSQRITITGLNPGAIYKFNATTYDFGTPGWKDSIITIQTTGFKTPSFSIQGTTATSITVKATFPSEFQWGNRIRYYNPATASWINATSSEDCYVKSGTYTINNLTAGVKYYIAFSYYDGITEVWTTEQFPATTTLPPESLLTYSYSNMIFQLDTPLVNLLTTAKANRMMANINDGYTRMHNLVGGAKPYNGDKMIFKTDRDILGGITEARSGQPILWRLDCAMERALEMNTLNADNAHAPIHEVAHNFDSYKWNFEPEVLSYIKTYYYFATTNQTMACQGQAFTGKSGYKYFMKSVATDSGGGMNYDGAIPYGNYSNYGLAYNLSNIADATGWTAFTKTFEYFHSLPTLQVPSTNIGKFNLFMTKLKDYSGVDVLAMFTAQEKSVYEAKLGGKMQYLNMLTMQEVFDLANYYVQQHGSGAYQILNEAVPLFDDEHVLFAYAVPFVDSSNVRAGHINVGARIDGLSFYLIDPVSYNYGAIKSYNDVGWAVKYAVPFLYYYGYGTSSTTTASASSFSVDSESAQSIPFTEQREYFNEENSVRNRALLDSISRSGESPASVTPRAVPFYAELSSEKGKNEYVRIKENISSTMYYGGNQSWWRNVDDINGLESRFSIYERSLGSLASTGCGAVAFADNILYHIQKDRTKYWDLLKHNHESKIWWPYPDVFELNPDYFNFNDRFSYTSLYMLKNEYIDFLDFYAHMGDIPTSVGVLAYDMDRAYKNLKEYTDFTYIKHKPASDGVDDVENFFITQLDNNIPVYMHNLLQHGVDDRYFINSPSGDDTSFDNHWMTVTQYYKGSLGDAHITFSSWGHRYSINTELIKVKDGSDIYNPNICYTPNFYAYEIVPK